jgi:voltage-gated potassium channel Kch
VLVVRMFSTDLAGGISRVLGDRATVISETELAAPAFLRAALSGNTGQRVSIAAHVLEVAEVDAEDPRLVVALCNAATPTDVLPPRAELDERVLGLIDPEGLVLGARGAFPATTMATVGYGDINLIGAPGWLKVYDVGLMAISAVLLASVLALITDVLVRTRIDRARGRFPRPDRDHVIVCGLGKAGSRIIAGLRELDVPCIGVEQHEGALGVTIARTLEVPVVFADGRTPGTMAALNVQSARAVMAVTSDDLANLQCGLTARELNPAVRVVLRIFDHHLAERLDRSVDLDVTRSVSALAAPAFTAALLGPAGGTGAPHLVHRVARARDRGWTRFRSGRRNDQGAASPSGPPGARSRRSLAPAGGHRHRGRRGHLRRRHARGLRGRDLPDQAPGPIPRAGGARTRRAGRTARPPPLPGRRAGRRVSCATRARAPEQFQRELP